MLTDFNDIWWECTSQTLFATIFNTNTNSQYFYETELQNSYNFSFVRIT